MAGFLRAVALDLDGTLTEHHELSEPALAAVDDVRADELAAVLVTGRILGELEQDHPGLARRFDAVVAENGAVLALEDEVRDLAAPVEESPPRRSRVVTFRSGADACCSQAMRGMRRSSSRRSGCSGSTARSSAIVTR